MAKIQPGLERISALLKDVTYPWKSIHVAGTNGKGSICHYASSMLVGRSVKVGKFTSPHLVDRWDCIQINGEPITEGKFRMVERHYNRLNEKLQIGASPFEILTAVAFTCFHDAKVKVGVVEVGMGGKLDSTNVLNNQAISVISKIARDHEGFLGNTLSEIAGHKAGILRPSVPYIINSTNEANVQSIIEDYAMSIGAGPRLSTTSWELQQRLYDSSKWNRATNKLLPFQQENLKLAVIAVMETLESMDKSTNPKELAKTLLVNASHRNPGRQELLAAIPVFREASHRENQILVDGAHNPDAARTLDEFVHNNMRLGQSPRAERPGSGWPVTWVLAMTEGKDAREYLATILKPGDKVVTTTFGPVDGMPWVKPMDPQKLLETARSVEPSITGVHVPIIGALRALCTAKYISDRTARWAPIALTGSLYLVGDLHRELRIRRARTWWTDPATHADREAFLKIHAEERERVSAILGVKIGGASLPSVQTDSDAEEQRKLQEELDALTREAQELEIEEERLVKDQSTISGSADDEQALSAVERLELEDRRFVELHASSEQLAASLARAEKAKEALARQQIAMEAAAKAREEKQERRLAQKQRLEERREKRHEKKGLEQEDAARRIFERIKAGHKTALPDWLKKKLQRDPSYAQGPRQARYIASSESPQDAISFQTEDSKVLSFPGARARAGIRRTRAPTPSDAVSEEDREHCTSPSRGSDSESPQTSLRPEPAKSSPTPADLVKIIPPQRSEPQDTKLQKPELRDALSVLDKPRAATASQAERRRGQDARRRKQGERTEEHEGNRKD
ncbi:folylpolyglutamate synthase [Didymella keratinophila]|nr:folylpolyglutamate synthase [Didymella keratinophila]